MDEALNAALPEGAEMIMHGTVKQVMSGKSLLLNRDDPWHSNPPGDLSIAVVLPSGAVAYQRLLIVHRLGAAWHALCAEDLPEQPAIGAPFFIAAPVTPLPAPE